MSTPLYIPCRGCLRPLTTDGCSNVLCIYGPGTGYSIPPPPKFTDQPDPFADICPTCGQPVPPPRPPSSG